MTNTLETCRAVINSESAIGTARNCKSVKIFCQHETLPWQSINYYCLTQRLHLNENAVQQSTDSFCTEEAISVTMPAEMKYEIKEKGYNFNQPSFSREMNL